MKYLMFGLTNFVLHQSKERAALCLGQLCVGEEKFPHRKIAIEGLLSSVQVSA